MKKIISLALAVMMLLTCAAFASADNEIELNVGILDGWTGFGTKYIVDQGLDVANGIKINYIVFSSGAPANEAMISGDIDCAIIGGGATVPSLANLDSKLIMEVNNDTIGQFNAKMQQYCQANQWYYVDVAEALSDEGGYLRDDYSGDTAMGIHLDYKGAGAWAEYLLTHVPSALK